MDSVMTYIVAGCLAVLGWAAKYFWDRIIRRFEKDEAIIKAHSEEEIRKIVNESVLAALEPIKEDIQQLSYQIKELDDDHNEKESLEILFIKNYLIDCCRKYLKKGFMYQYEFDSLSNIHNVYHNLGGNDQGDEYYEKVLALPIHQEKKAEE